MGGSKACPTVARSLSIYSAANFGVHSLTQNEALNAAAILGEAQVSQLAPVRPDCSQFKRLHGGKGIIYTQHRNRGLIPRVFVSVTSVPRREAAPCLSLLLPGLSPHPRPRPLFPPFRFCHLCNFYCSLEKEALPMQMKMVQQIKNHRWQKNTTKHK